MTTKLYVDDLSAVGLSTDYLYAKDSNIKTDVKIEPVDNSGEKIATIVVNGEATEISAKQIDVDDSFSFESTNPVQNKVVTTCLNELCAIQDKWLNKEIGGVVIGPLSLSASSPETAHDLELVYGNYKQGGTRSDGNTELCGIIGSVKNFSYKNSFLQAEEAFSGGAPHALKPCYCVLGVDPTNKTIRLSGDISEIAADSKWTIMLNKHRYDINGLYPNSKVTVTVATVDINTSEITVNEAITSLNAYANLTEDDFIWMFNNAKSLFYNATETIGNTVSPAHIGSYGYAATGTKCYCILGRDQTRNAIILSGNISQLAEGANKDKLWSYSFSNSAGSCKCKIATIDVDDLTHGYVTFVDDNGLLAAVGNATEEECIDLFRTDDNAFYCPTDPYIGNLIPMNFYGSSASGGSARAIGKYSHAEGRSCTADSRYSHAEGSFCIAGGIYSHAEGNSCKAFGIASHAAGTKAIADHDNSYVWSAISEIHSPESGSFTINPKNGINSFYIGNNNFIQCVLNSVRQMTSEQKQAFKTALGL